jgi:hypothetical protein
MTTARRPQYVWDPEDTIIAESIAQMTEVLAKSGHSDEVIDLYVLDFLEATHKRWPDKVRIKGKPNLRIVK